MIDTPIAGLVKLALRDFLDRCGLVAPLGEQRPGDVDQLMAAFSACHPGPRGACFLVCYRHVTRVIR